ncbi:MAG: hypothetical protein II797_03465 [Clostridia bacterium]|nr:hypothetical protein [Clostridia bacterium]
MREYVIYSVPSREGIVWDEFPAAPIDIYRWKEGWTPRSEAKVVLAQDYGFLAHLTSEEDKPFSRYTRFYDPVWNDSCLEFFVGFDGGKKDYLNIEMNPIGGYLIGFGPGREGRVRIDEIVGEPFPEMAEIHPGKWSVTVAISFEDIEKIFGLKKETFVSGYSFRGNFFKCGSEAPVVHYGMWNDT